MQSGSSEKGMSDAGERSGYRICIKNTREVRDKKNLELVGDNNILKEKMKEAFVSQMKTRKGKEKIIRRDML